MSDQKKGTLEKVTANTVVIDGHEYHLGKKAITAGLSVGIQVRYYESNGYVNWIGVIGDQSGPKPHDTYPTKTEERRDAEMDRQKIILWQNCMTQANSLLYGVFGDKESDQDRFKRHMAMSYAIYEASLRVWRNTPPIPETRPD